MKGNRKTADEHSEPKDRSWVGENETARFPAAAREKAEKAANFSQKAAKRLL